MPSPGGTAGRATPWVSSDGRQPTVPCKFADSRYMLSEVIRLFHNSGGLFLFILKVGVISQQLLHVNLVFLPYPCYHCHAAGINNNNNNK